MFRFFYYLFTRLSFVPPNVRLGKNVRIGKFCNIYGPTYIGDNTKLGAYVEIQNFVHIGDNCKISSHSFICSGVRINRKVFIGHGVIFINDSKPRACNENGKLQNENDWILKTTEIRNRASIGSNATIMPVTIGYKSMIGAGAVVTKNIPDKEVWLGNPARLHKIIDES